MRDIFCYSNVISLPYHRTPRGRGEKIVDIDEAARQAVQRPSMKRVEKDGETRRSGFALVLALSLMAFVLLLLVSMTLLVRVETKSAAAAIDSLRSQETARLALLIALGELQRHAGPDQRVTARADILGDNSINLSARFWTGVWDSTAPSAPPIWLVSGDNPSPVNLTVDSTIITRSYDADENGDFESPEDLPAVRAPLQPAEGGEVRYAWWISDEGIKAAVSPVDGLAEGAHDPASFDVLDYNPRTLRTATTGYDSVFDFDDLDLSGRISPDTMDSLRRAVGTEQLSLIASAAPDPAAVGAELLHDVVLDNRFVLANPLDGGLKRDLSYLKVLDSETTTDADLEALFEDPDGRITREMVRLVNFEADPTFSYETEDIGMRIFEDSAADANGAGTNFSLVPVVTEFQLSAGVAADRGKPDDDVVQEADLYFVNKLYLELWNPYTVPFRIGDPAMVPDLGFSDLRIEIDNLPNYTITNLESDASVSGSIPPIAFLWSDYKEDKSLRPGMVYRETLPGDGGGANETGVNQLELGTKLEGRVKDRYRGTFGFGGSPLEIRVFGIRSDGEEREIYRFLIDGYPDYSIEYDPSDRLQRFRRVPTSKEGQFGMNSHSLETPGYAFAFRFRMLDEQEPPHTTTDISNWLSLYDVRKRGFEVDLATWDFADPWTQSPPLPYDFRVNEIDFDPGFFEPTQSFKSEEFFHYNSGGTGRLDRIARIIDLPVGEVNDIGVFRSLMYRDVPLNGVGNPWGGELNRMYDRYFFSTLPDPDNAEWDGEEPLLNARIRPHGEVPTLGDPDNADALILANGFNLNATSERAWEKVLAGRDFSENEFAFRYEKANFPKPPAWTTSTEPLRNVWFNLPQTASYNLTEHPSESRYELVTKANSDDYLREFSIDSVDWQSDLQHPAFRQPIREVSNQSIVDLSRAIVAELESYQNDRGHPPFSLSEYLNAGILQNAIDEVPGLNNRKGGQDRIPRHAPASVTQATLMNALGPIAFVRSDTFTIRACAQTRDPATGEYSSFVFCEARVQRIPEPVENTNFGRRFEILDFNWISLPQ